jgi:hypothetical protein
MTDRPKSTPERPLGSIARSEHPTGSADVGQSFEWRELSRSLMGSFQISGFDHDGLKVARGFGRQHGHRHLLESIGLRRVIIAGSSGAAAAGGGGKPVLSFV